VEDTTVTDPEISTDPVPAGAAEGLCVTTANIAARIQATRRRGGEDINRMDTRENTVTVGGGRWSRGYY